MPKVKITRACAVGGKHLHQGQTFETTEDAAKHLIHIGRAIPLDAKAPAKADNREVEQAEAISTKDAGDLVSTDKPKRARRK